MRRPSSFFLVEHHGRSRVMYGFGVGLEKAWRYGGSWLGSCGKRGVLGCIARGSLTIGRVQRESCDVFFTCSLIARGILTYTINKETYIFIRTLVISRLQ